MAHDLARLLVFTLLWASLAWAGITLVVMLIFGVPTRVPPPPVARSKRGRK